MCGRFALFATVEEIVAHFHLMRGFSMVARYNIAPTQTIPIIRAPGEQVDFVRWGLVGAWTKACDSKVPSGCFNLRQETLVEKPAFQQIFAQKRCIVPASGYFVWKMVGGRKQPFYVRLSQQLLVGFAGVWDRWVAPNGEVVESCAILTRPSNTQVARIQDSMPVILLAEDYLAWLSKKTAREDLPARILRPNTMEAQILPVTPRMNHPSFDVPACVQSLS